MEELYRGDREHKLREESGLSGRKIEKIDSLPLSVSVVEAVGHL